MRAAPQWCLTAWHTGPIGSAWLIDIRLRFPIDSLPGESIDPLFGAALRMRGLYQAEGPKQELQELRCRAMLDRNFPFNELELDPALLGELMQTLNSSSVTLQGPECFPENDADMNHLRLSYGSTCSEFHWPAGAGWGGVRQVWNLILCLGRPTIQNPVSLQSDNGLNHHIGDATERWLKGQA